MARQHQGIAELRDIASNADPTPALLSAYLDHVRLPEPRHCDKVFVLKGYEPGINAVVGGESTSRRSNASVTPLSRSSGQRSVGDRYAGP